MIKRTNRMALAAWIATISDFELSDELIMEIIEL